ncbi:hypothetical protein RRF57_000714 [Xylaria bambusicola]|uniref:NACHT-NTPase and P-loop NTPases N-terminal domain-containing protein n=1 Tax=Xylaria bambusicola TaxID=326684 RepID=A0AAN7Z2S9_9PEZI
MATFAFIGLASNVLQFIQIGTQLALEARKLYKSAGGSTGFNAQVEADAEYLISLMEQIRTSITTAPRGTKAEQQLLESAKTCEDVADSLVKLLAVSKFRYVRRSPLEAIKQAIYNESTRDQIAQLHKRLRGLQSATVLGVVMMLRYCNRAC